MNPVEKPKSVKLWKNSGASVKKQKGQKPNFNSESQTDMKKGNKKRKLEPAVEAEKPNLGGKQNFYSDASSPNKKMKKWEKGETPKHQNLKRKNESEDSSKKKGKNDDLTWKQRKILHLGKKDKVPSDRKDDTEVKSTPKVKPENMSKKQWKKLKMEKKGKGENFELGQKLKKLWENFRREDCKAEEKKQMLKQTCAILKGRVMEFTFAHDTVRVLECVIMEGSDADRTLLFNEIQNEIIPLAKSKYGKFALLKILRYGSKDMKNTIMKAFHGKVIKLIKHAEAAEVVELAFNECANASQRFEFVQEFYGPTFKYFKTTDCHTLGELFENEPDKKAKVIENMKVELMKVLEKTVVKHSMVHHVLWQFMQYADQSSKSEIIESVRDAVPEILHSKDGSRVGMHCVWFGTPKDRKVIVKSMKTFVSKIAMEEHGHMVLLALFDCFDDTKLLSKRIIEELEKNLLEIAQNVHGKKVLSYLLNPRDPHYIHPDVINILKTGDGNEASKKDPEVRQNELKVAVAKPLLNLVKENIQNLYKNNAFCLFTLTVLKHAVGDRTEAFQSIADLAVEPYTTENKNVHVIEHAGSNFLLKQLLIQDRDGPEDNGTFSEVLITRIPNCVFKSWIECNRGAFLLVSLLETQLPSVVSRIKKELEGCKKYLTKKNYKGAEILLKKLKE